MVFLLTQIEPNILLNHCVRNKFFFCFDIGFASLDCAGSQLSPPPLAPVYCDDPAIRDEGLDYTRWPPRPRVECAVAAAPRAHELIAATETRCGMESAIRRLPLCLMSHGRTLKYAMYS